MVASRVYNGGWGRWSAAGCEVMRQNSLLLVISGVLIAATACVTARGEVFVLKSGGRIEGQHLNPQRQAGQPYQLRTGDGVQLALAENVVQRVVVKTDLVKQYEAAAPKLQNTVESQWGMAEWCREVGLLDQRKRHLQAVIALDPNHEEARNALGFTKYGGKWLTQDQHMESQGYVRYKGAWRTRQEIEIDAAERQKELAEKQWRRDLRRWLDQAEGGGKHAETAERALNDVTDVNAVPALVEVLADKGQSPAARLRCLDILAKLPPGLATAMLLKVAMEDPDDKLRERCIDEIKRAGTHTALPPLIAELKSKINARVNRAAECLRLLGDKDATLPLIDALVTEHIEMVSPGGSPGGLSLGFGSGSGGSGQGGGGLGSFGVGGRPKAVKKKLDNTSVRDALVTLYPGENHGFDAAAWRRWYTEKNTTTNVDLRRDE
jgi:hypothetical protein